MRGSGEWEENEGGCGGRSVCVEVGGWNGMCGVCTNSPHSTQLSRQTFQLNKHILTLLPPRCAPPRKDLHGVFTEVPPLR